MAGKYQRLVASSLIRTDMLQYKNRNEFKVSNESVLMVIHFLRSFHEDHLISNTKPRIVNSDNQMSIHGGRRMFGLFKSPKQKFVEGMENYLSRLVRIAQSRHALYELSERMEDIAGNNIYQPAFAQYYEESQNKDLSLNLQVIKNECLVAIILHEVVNPKVAPVLQVLARKRKTLITKDDYGDYQFDKWFKELNSFCDNKLSRDIESWLYNPKNIALFNDNVPYDFTHLEDGFLVLQLKYDLQESIEKMIDQYEINNETDTDYDETMSGHEYEFYVAEQFENQGFNAQVTKGSGDHGVDVLVEYDNAKIAVQCKHYNSPVGNKAVQEVYSAKDIFDCELAAVVTNNTFTPAAREAAEKLGVFLLHHEDIPSLCSVLIGDDE